jgi:hypothetical protein
LGGHLLARILFSLLAALLCGIASASPSGTEPPSTGILVTSNAQPASGSPDNIMISVSVKNDSAGVAAPFTAADAWSAVDLHILDAQGNKKASHGTHPPKLQQPSRDGHYSGGLFSRKSVLLKPGESLTIGNAPAALTNWGYDALPVGKYQFVIRVLVMQPQGLREAQSKPVAINITK